MSPEGSTAMLVLVSLASLVVLAVALVQMLMLKGKIDRFESIIDRATELGADQARRVATLESFQDAQRVTEDVLETGTSIVREVHKGIASIPFGILESIPGAREPAKLVRGLHDSISDGIYGALSGLNKAVGREWRRGMKTDWPKEVANGLAELSNRAPEPTKSSTAENDQTDSSGKR